MKREIKYGLVIIESLILLCVNIIMGGSILPIFQHYTNLNKQNYDMVYQYGNNVDVSDSFYILDGVLTYKKGKGFKAEYLMQKPVLYSDAAPFSLSYTLCENEIAVTKNILNAINKQVGDTIELYNPIYDLYIEYTIAHELDQIYGLYENSLNKELGVVIVCFDEKIPEMTDIKSVLFASDDLKASETGISLDWSYDKSEKMKSLLSDGIVKTILMFVLITLLISVFVVAYVAFAYPRLAKMFRMGASETMINKYINNNYTIPNVISAVLASVLWGIINCFSSNEITIGLFASFILCLPSILIGSLFMKKYVRRRN